MQTDKNVSASSAAADEGNGVAGAPETSASECQTSANMTRETSAGEPETSESLAAGTSAKDTGADGSGTRADGPLFSAQSPLGEKEAYILADQISAKLAPAVSVTVFVVCALLSAVLGFLDGDTVFGVALLCCGAVVAIVLLFLYPYLIRRGARKSLLYTDAVSCMDVYGDRVQFCTLQGNEQVSGVTVYFRNIQKVVQSKGYVLVYLTRSQACVLAQSGFYKGTAEEFIGFCSVRGIRVVSKGKKG